MKKSKEFFNTTVFYTLPALWKATPKKRKEYFFDSISIPIGISLIASIIIPSIIGRVTGYHIAFVMLFIPLFTFIFFVSWKMFLLPQLEELVIGIIYPDSLIRMKYISAKWHNETIQLYMESKEGTKREYTLKEFLEHFQGKYQLFYREEGVMGKVEVQIEPSQVNDLKPQLTPLQIDMEIQQDGTVAIYLDHREHRWYDNIKPVNMK